VAILMSGGLDSTTIAALAARAKGRAQIPLYASSWVFDELKASDEREFMLPVVERFDLKWLPVPADNLWPLSDFETWPHDPNSPIDNPYRRLSTASYDAVAAQGCRVLLNGEFGDHLFAGWAYWLRDLLSEGRLLAAAREVYSGLRSDGAASLRSPLVRALFGKTRQTHRNEPKMPWLSPRAASLLADHPEIPHSVRRPEQWQQLCHPENALGPTLEIRHAAHHGIENRRVFRDLRLIELALQMPAHLFRRAGSHKWLLRQLNRGLLPEPTRTRRWTSTLAPLFIRGVFEREADRVEDLLWSNDRHWPALVREDWMRDNLPLLEAGAPDGVAWVVLWRVLTYEIWRRRESYENPHP
jgi:asparagine synthetase B (glutamine-hydrolysing)